MLFRYISLLLLLSGGLFIATAQENNISLSRSVIGSLGQDIGSDHIQLSATVGEAAVSTLTTDNLILTQGFQQAEKEDLTSTYFRPDMIESVALFPNPASTRVSLDVTTEKNDNFNIEIFDALGKRWKSQRGIDLDDGIKQRLRFDLNDVPNGNYFIRITDSRGKLAASVQLLIQK